MKRLHKHSDGVYRDHPEVTAVRARIADQVVGQVVRCQNVATRSCRARAHVSDQQDQRLPLVSVPMFLNGRIVRVSVDGVLLAGSENVVEMSGQMRVSVAPDTC